MRSIIFSIALGQKVHRVPETPNPYANICWTILVRLVAQADPLSEETLWGEVLMVHFITDLKRVKADTT